MWPQPSREYLSAALPWPHALCFHMAVGRVRDENVFEVLPDGYDWNGTSRASLFSQESQGSIMKTITQIECFECGNGALIPGIVNLVGTRNDEEFNVRVHGLECSSCGFQTIDNSQSGEFTKALSDAYRAAHGFLTGAEIKERRHDWLNMSHQAFARHLGVGVASTKRWENGQVQDRAMDNLIRLKTDPQAARDSLKDLESQVGTEHVLSSVALGSEDLNLLFSREQKFTSKPQIKMGVLKFEKGSFNKEFVLAA